jgi:hypothetical protein
VTLGLHLCFSPSLASAGAFASPCPAPAAPPRTLAPPSPRSTPLFAALTSHPQLAEKSATLTPAFAALTRCVNSKSFGCHSYTKHGGCRTAQHSSPQLRSANSFSPQRRRGSSFTSLTSYPDPATYDRSQLQSPHALAHTFRRHGVGGCDQAGFASNHSAIDNSCRGGACPSLGVTVV